MIIFTKDMFSNDIELNSFIDNTNTYLNNSIQLQENFRQCILNYMQKFSDSSLTIASDYINIVLEILENLKNTLNLCNENIDNLNSLSLSFNNLIQSIRDNKLDSNQVLEFNINSSKVNKFVIENTLKIESFLNSILQYSNLNFGEKKTSSDGFDLNQPPESIDKKSDTNSSSLVENTLIISETKGKVFLPYNINELNEILKNNTDMYSDIYDIIEKKYVIPLDTFKNFPISRFREAFKLSRIKEKESIKSAFDLGMELLFNYNLHPAIISACRNIDELDIYLDYLDNNETNKFDCFNIVFDIPPILKK